MDNLLSDGNPVRVRRLKFLELENEVPYPDPGLYIHTYMIDGHPQHVGYGLDDYQEIPDKPKTPQAEAKPDSYEAALWEQYNLYRAVLTHEHKRKLLKEQHHIDVAQYILNTCLAPEDAQRIVTPDDFILIYRLALCPEVGEEDIIAVLASTFQGDVAGEIFMGLDKDAQGVGGQLLTDSPLGA